MTLLSAVNDAQRELSLAVTAALVADGQETQNLLFRMAKKESQDVLRRSEYNFPALRRTQSFTATTGATLQAAPGKPADFKRAISDTFWNVSSDRQIGGPLSEQEWALANGDSLVSTITQWAMFRYDGLHIYPAPTVADTITFDYIINTPVQATGAGAYKTAFTADTDEYLLGDELLTLGVVWRYMQIKGRDYAEAMKDYELALAAECGSARGSRILSVAPAEADPFAVNVPESGFG